MPGKLKVRIVAARNLPVMDRATDLTDAFVEIKFGNTTYKTDVCRKSLDPRWNSEWYRFEVGDEDLQDEPLQIRVLDHDTYSAHDSIGKVYIDLNPLLTRRKESVLNGWYPIYDTMHGIRGQLHVIVKVDLFSDSNKFRQSSCGVRFFCTSGVPQGYQIETLHGFVEELVVNDDPEYQWIDKIRSMRASNEARQMQFSKLSGQLQRMIGLKVLEMGGNAVIGYRQCFDLEGESGLVVRAIGTAVSLGKTVTHPQFSSPQSISPIPDSPRVQFSFGPIGGDDSLSPAQSVQNSAVKPAVRHSSESEVETPPKVDGPFFETPPKGVLLGGMKMSVHRPAAYQESIDMMEYPFFTVKTLPSGFIAHVGGVVSARSVKLLDKIHNPDEPETRDAWWAELRTEIRSHMRAMGCHAVLGYSEQTSIRDELIILSAIGTAATVRCQAAIGGGRIRQLSGTGQQANAVSSLVDRLASIDESVPLNQRRLHVDVSLANDTTGAYPSNGCNEDLSKECSLCHIPYQEANLPFPIHLNRCAVCGIGKVPDVLFTTIEPPRELPIVGRGCFIQARICRAKKDVHGEANAKDISDSLPFLEYELHKQLINKLKVKGMNSLFRLKVQIGVGLNQLVALATATGVYCAALPPLPIPQIVVKDHSDVESSFGFGSNDSDEVSFAGDSKWSGDTCILEIDDTEDAQIVSILIDPPMPEGFDVCNTETMPGIPHLVSNLQMFTKVWRGHIGPVTNVAFSAMFDNILKSLYFKLRMMTPCVLCHLDFDLDLSETDEIQVSVTGVCVGVGEPFQQQQSESATMASVASRNSLRHSEIDLEKSAEGDQLLHESFRTSPSHSVQNRLCSIASPPSQGQLSRSDAHSCMYSITPATKAFKQKHMRYHMQAGTAQKRGIELTPLSYVPGARIEQYTGHLNFFIIRETTSVREEGGLNGFMHSFLAEVMAICRAHVAALGGNALVAYQLTECIIEDNVHKNQSQCLVNVCGDVVLAVYGTETLADAAAATAAAVQQSSATTSSTTTATLKIPSDSRVQGLSKTIKDNQQQAAAILVSS